MRSKLLHLLLLFLPMLAPAQDRHAVKGRVYEASLGIKNVLVVNNNAQVETRTDSLGNFTINAKVGDLIILSDFKIETKKIRYTPDLIKNGLMLLEVKMVAEEIEEVVINRSTITSESLGIPMGKAYTVQERRLRAGTSDPIGTIINLLSGRTKMLKANVNLEKRVTAKETLDELFDNSYFTNDLKLTAEQVEAFKFYAVENEKLREELKGSNKTIIQFTLAGLAEDYKKQSDAK